APAPTVPAKPKTKIGPQKAVADDDGAAFDPIGKKFMFTGKLSSMTREEAKAKVLAIRGVPAGSVSKDLDYLVVGDQGSHLFGAGAKGDKIITAENLQANGFPVKIIAESAFMAMAAKATPKKTPKKPPKKTPATPKKTPATPKKTPKKPSKTSTKAKPVAKPTSKSAVKKPAAKAATSTKTSKSSTKSKPSKAKKK
ncbi:MAG: BRCT domain-containing protein, partial [Proteobacteria bacterium]|nr:BRCT domain-containing protein [Pseudomonadota bacterium]